MSDANPGKGIEQSVNADGESVVFNLGSGTQSNAVTQNFYGGGAVAGADPETCYRYGRMKFEARDFAEAEFPLITAAEAGHLEAARLLVTLYQLTSSAGKAAQWVRQLAEAGDPDSCYEMGAKIMMGASFAQSHTRRRLEQAATLESALQWFGKAQEAGDKRATKEIGLILYDLERYEEAVPHLERVVNSNRPGSSEAEQKLKSARKFLKKQEEKERLQESGAPKPRWWRKGG